MMRKKCVCNMQAVVINVILSEAKPNERQLIRQLCVNSSELTLFFSANSFSLPRCLCLFPFITFTLAYRLGRSMFVSVFEFSQSFELNRFDF